MAGEWLKFESNLPEKPETLAITAAMGWDDPDLTVGKLMRVFRWFDQQTIDGNAPGVTAALLDRVIGVTGFVQAMCNVGWIVVADNGLSLQNFDRHNGETAKKRAQTAKRVANHRSNAKGNDDSNADSVTEALAREEKRREEDKEKAQAPSVPDWMPMEAWTGYLDMRKKIRKTPTNRALKLVIKSLTAMHDKGVDVSLVLDNSTRQNWVDVYEPKSNVAPIAAAPAWAGAR